MNQKQTEIEIAEEIIKNIDRILEVSKEWSGTQAEFKEIKEQYVSVREFLKSMEVSA